MRRMANQICVAGLLLTYVLSQNTGSHYLRQAAVSSAAGVVHIEANSPRPLSQVLDALQLKYGWIVDYEDPQYIAASDLVDAPAGSAASKLPNGANFSVQFPVAGTEEEKTLRLIVDSYNHSNNPGRFDVRRNADGNLDVVGTAAHDEKGAIAKQSVMLDLPVTLAASERSITDTVNLICQEISAHSQISVSVGVTPRKLMDHAMVKVGGSKVAARDLLSQALRAARQNLYWRLLFDPSSKGYFLEIHSSQPS